ncbi:MAG: peptidyl-prolyl cis-trans isomerase, partial [Alphaproteobacteria bacterium]|nr:peptidyl-prolyl cis-trans isomerase [Alphaproteobacteria bacterium]
QGMLGDVLGGLARRAVFMAEAERLGLTVTREMEKSHVANETAFLDETGQFSVLRFRDTLARAGLDEESYLNYVNGELQGGQIFAALIPGVNYSPALAAEIAAWRLERRVISYVEIDVSADAAATPTEAELDAWYADNGESYDSPDLRSVTALVLSPEGLLDDVEVSEDDLRAEYEARSDNFITPERRVIRQMVFAAEDEAADAVNRIKAGESFADVAMAMLSLTDDDTRLGSLVAEDLTEELSAPAFDAATGEAIGPLATALGQHVLMVDDITPSTTVSFEDARPGLATSLEREAATDLVYSRIATLEDSLSSGATLEEAARAAGAELVTIDGMDRSGRDIDGNALDGIAADTKFRQSVWTADINEDGFVEETNADTFFVLRVNSEAPSAPRPLADVRDRVIADIKLERAVEAARATAESMVAADNLADAAKANNVTVIESPAMRRDGVSFDHSAARLIAAKAFTLGLDETSFVETGDQAVVMTVNAIMPAEGEALADETERMQTSLSANVASSLEGIVANGLTRTHEVSINAQAVQNLLIGQPN